MAGDAVSSQCAVKLSWDTQLITCDTTWLNYAADLTFETTDRLIIKDDRLHSFLCHLCRFSSPVTWNLSQNAASKVLLCAHGSCCLQEG